MFGRVRVIIGLIFFFSIIVLVSKIKVSSRRIYYVASALISIIMVTILAFIPFENLFISFNSPESVYNYVNFGPSSIKLVVKGDNSDFVIGEKNNRDIYLIVPKTDEGWKIGTGTNMKEIYRTNTNENVVHLYQYENTDDYYITIFNISGGYAEITDNYGSSFLFVEKKNESLNKTFVTYYAYIHNFDAPYLVIVNGDKIEVKGTQGDG